VFTRSSGVPKCGVSACRGRYRGASWDLRRTASGRAGAPIASSGCSTRTRPRGRRGTRATVEDRADQLGVDVDSLGRVPGVRSDLHIEAGEVFAREAAGGNAKLETILHARMTQNLDLDRGNAHPGSLGRDYARFGLDLWADLDGAFAARKSGWNAALTTLNETRNAIAHSQSGKIAALNPTLATNQGMAQVAGRIGCRDGPCSDRVFQGSVRGPPVVVPKEEHREESTARW